MATLGVPKPILLLLGMIVCLYLFHITGSLPSAALRTSRAEYFNYASQVRERKADKTCYILYWTNFYRWVWLNDQVLKDGFFSPSPERSCVITSKRDYLPSISDYDALIFFQWNLHEPFPPPETRHPDQLYIVHYLESPQRSLNRSFIGENSHLFNMTMSFRLDADIVWPYGHVLDKNNNNVEVAPRQKVNWRAFNKEFKGTEKQREMMAKKKKMISWVVSNCDDDPSERMALAHSLQKFIQIDVYGKCGKPCDRKSCKSKLAEEYFFYLAFENSLAMDYVSEKTFLMIGHGTIPVVYGGADYSRFLPPKSYINAQDFSSTEELATFLTNLSKDTEEYLSYFWWMDHYTINTGNSYSNLCARLQEERRKLGQTVHYYKDMTRWEQEGTWVNRTIQIS